MKRIILNVSGAALMFVALLATTSCNNKKFRIEGSIAKAADKMLYLENMSLSEGVVVLDSVKLDDDGNFAFSHDAPDAPEFYRLRILNQIINLSIDSTETVTVKANYPEMATGYEVSGSDNCQKIKELSLRQIDLLNKATAISQNSTLGIEATNDSIERLVNAYKELVKRDYIFKEPMKAYAYFALFQTLGNRLIFAPRENKEDIKVFAAVATSWDSYYPEALRGKNLHNIAIEGMKNVRLLEAQRQDMEVEAGMVSTAGLINIALTDNKGVQRRLTDLKGQVVLLDFHLFGTSESTERIMNLRDIYNKYHNRGLEIYQVSLDPNEHLWKTKTAALPWISVRDGEGINSRNLLNYNVQTIPTFFLIDRSNALYKRDIQIKDLDAEIQSLL
ncbi:MAG: DUF4369 domain-containing protein [Prevotella sp.]|nr:DUF4369 domain-containing protein [Prevotella sp.]